jgi:hypothetical protein
MKKLTVIILCVLMLVMLSVCCTEAAPNEGEVRNFRSELTGGMWHASPVLGSGWSNRLGFLDDNTFIYSASEMDGQTRERFIAGEWGVSSDGLLTLFCREALKWEGGEIVPATASTGTDIEIINADLIKVKYNPAKRIEIQIGDYIYDDDTPRPWKINLRDADAMWGGDGWWWKYEGDWDLNDLLDSYKSANSKAADSSGFAPNTALRYLKEAVEQRMPHGYYLEDEDYETRDEKFLKHDDDVYLLGTSTEQIRGGVAYCFEFNALRLFGGRAIVFADGTVVLDFDDSYNDYLHLFPDYISRVPWEYKP